MLVVMSNNGEWDANMFGVVAVINNPADLAKVAAEQAGIEFAPLTQAFEEWSEDNKATILYTGQVVASVIGHYPDGETDIVYVAIDLDAQLDGRSTVYGWSLSLRAKRGTVQRTD